MTDLHTKLAACHPKLARGQVWCRTCRSTRRCDSAGAMRHGWPKCCGYTMTIDPPEEWPPSPDKAELHNNNAFHTAGEMKENG